MSTVLLEHLPAIFQTNEQFAKFLEPFEAILLGPDGLRKRILDLPRLLDPWQTPEEFLPWLAGWVALTLRRDLPLERQRALIANAVPLYVWRGTIHGMKTLLELVTGKKVSIVEPQIVGLRIGTDSVVGSSTRLGRELPHYFHVTIDIPKTIVEDRAWLETLSRETLDLAKPAHTFYKLQLVPSGEQDNA